MKVNDEILEKLKKELVRIESTKRADYDLLKSQDHVPSSTICKSTDLSDMS